MKESKATRPEELDNLCGPAFKDACTLELRNIVDTQEVTVDGKKKKVRTLKPISTAVAEYKAENSGSGDSGSGSSGGSDLPPSGTTGE